MTEQNRRSISPDEIATLLPSSSASSAATESSTTKQRRKRKWDQPDESLFPSAVSIPGILPSVTMSSMGGILLPAVAPASAALLTNFVAASNTNISQLIQAPMAHNEVAALVLKQTQSKIQDELIIAREIVINDADAAVRYKLTKRQTQEEIQKSTGAVVITRGKYRPPNSVPDGEKPLYLHISAGAHLKETAERIIAVDLAAAMVEEMRKQDQNVPLTSSINSTAGGVKVSQPLSTCVYLGFDADPSVDIAARIRGPNEQYINHIMNETGALVLLRGQGSGIHGSTTEGQQPLHLFLSCIDPKGLEDARLLADNLLDTISRECGSTRVMSGRAYSAVPPPPNLLDGVHSSRNEPKSNLSLSPSPASSVSSPIASAIVSAPGLMTAVSYGPFAQPGRLLNASQLLPKGISYPQPSLSSGTSYSGYGGIYPQATPLQQVALALRHSNAVTPATAAMISATPLQKSTDGSSEKKQVHQKRKFQESPATLRGAAASQQGSETMDLGISSSGIPTGRVSFLPPKKFAGSASTSMPPPPPRNSTMLLPPPKNDTMPPPPPKNDTMPPPPPRNGTMPPPLPRSGPMPRPPPRNGPTMPPPSPRSLTEPLPALKFCSLTSVHEESGKVSVPNKLKPENVPDTLSQIMEYGEDDDEEEDDESDVRISLGKSTKPGAPKPF